MLPASPTPSSWMRPLTTAHPEQSIQLSKQTSDQHIHNSSIFRSYPTLTNRSSSRYRPKIPMVLVRCCCGGKLQLAASTARRCWHKGTCIQPRFPGKQLPKSYSFMWKVPIRWEPHRPLLPPAQIPGPYISSMTGKQVQRNCEASV